MSRNVTIMTCNGYKYVRVCESYRNAEGKPRSKVIENHGRLDQLEAKDPEYVAKLRERVRQENEAAKAAYALNLENAAQSRIRRLESIAKKADLPKAQAEVALKAFIETTKKALKKGDQVQLIGFGTFCVAKRAARTGRNPQTGETIKIKATKLPKFKPGKTFKEAL